MTTHCRTCPLRNLPCFTPFSDEELSFMPKFKSGELNVDAGTVLLEEGSSAPQFFTVLAGMGLRTKMLENGRRQVLNFVFPGDLLGLQAGVMGQNGHTIVASTPMRLCVFRRSELWTLYRTQPERAYDLTWLSAIEEHFLGETLATLGQRDAIQRVSWALHRIHHRLRMVEIGTEGRVPLPFRQQDLADALGLSLVHTNKTLRRLRERQVAAWDGGTMAIADLDELARIGLVDDTEPRRRPLL